MLSASVDRILGSVGEDDLVLDVGGWARPFARADWVIDLMPYESRGMLGRDGGTEERFSATTWVQRDICDREPFPFEDGQFDLVVCSHTLEDIRDPVWVCSEMARVGKAGYIEVPSRLEEQSYGVHGPWVGWSHHRWLIDVTPGRIEFVMKPHVLLSRNSDHFPAGFHDALSDEDKVETLWWRAGFEFGERVLLSAEEVDPYLSEYVRRHLAERGYSRPAGRFARTARRIAGLRGRTSGS
jgi:hypothetical protein